MIPLLIMASASAASSGLQQGAANKAAIEKSNAENKGIIDWNQGLTIREAYRSGLAKVGLAQQKRAVALNTHKAREAGLSAASEAEANAAATGAIGASAEAVAADVAQRVGEFEADNATNMENVILNYNMQVESTALETASNVRYPTRLGVPGSMEVLGRATASGAITAGSVYSQSLFNLKGP